MTRSNNVSVLRRAYETLVSGVSALTLTALMLVTVNAQADAPQQVHSVTPSVTILVPTVTIEPVDEASPTGVR
jgi:hypothetical protein